MKRYSETVRLHCTERCKSGVPLRCRDFRELGCRMGLNSRWLVRSCSTLLYAAGLEWWLVYLSFVCEIYERNWATDGVTYVEPGTGSTAIGHIVDQSNSR